MQQRHGGQRRGDCQAGRWRDANEEGEDLRHLEGKPADKECTQRTVMVVREQHRTELELLVREGRDRVGEHGFSLCPSPCMDRSRSSNQTLFGKLNDRTGSAAARESPW